MSIVIFVSGIETIKKPLSLRHNFFIPKKQTNQPIFIFIPTPNYMATLTNKDKRIKQLENDLKQEREIIDTLKKRITTLEKRKRN